MECGGPNGVGVMPISDESISYLLCETGGPRVIVLLLINDFPVGDGIAYALLLLLVEFFLHFLVHPMASSTFAAY